MKNNFNLSIIILIALNLIFVFQEANAQSYFLYGVTQYGGTNNKGVVYRYSYPSGQDTVILNFNDTNGAIPEANLIEATDGNFYGTTTEGGTSNEGVFYCINPETFKDTVLISFNGTNGDSPHNALFQASNGLLYGLTSKGGTQGKGLCFSYDIVTKTQTILFSFDGINGTYPDAEFIQASNGFLIGHAKEGGLYGDGTLFYYNINTGNDSVLVNFNDTNGSFATGGLLQATNGLIYGTNILGGSTDYGVLFSYNLLNGTLAVLLNFNGPNGIYPSGDRRGLFQSSSGLLYGLTHKGGTYNYGLMYCYNINTGQDSILLNFSTFNTLGNNPASVGFEQIASGILFTPIDSGGAYGFGTILSYDPSNGNVVKLLDFNDTNGATPSNDLLVIEKQTEQGINTVQHKNISNLYPNPNNGIFTLQYPGINNPSRIEIYNMLGEKVYVENISSVNNNTIINLGFQSKGIYLYRLTSEDGSIVSSGKFIIE